jgi:hypothetical protein
MTPTTVGAPEWTPVEELPAGESAAIQEMLEELTSQLVERYIDEEQLVRRDAHPKTVGLVRAQLIVSPDCPAELRYGVFNTPGQTFAAEIRYSNGDPIVTHDLALGVRGMAIKLPEIPGDFLEEPGQDFVLATAEAFFGKDAVDYADFPRASRNTFTTIGYFLRRPSRFRGGWRLLQAQKIPRSPLAIGYFSQTPYRLGPHCVKYYARPLVARRAANDPWYMLPVVRQIAGFAAKIAPVRVGRWIPADALKTALVHDLAAGSVTFELLAQRWPDLANLPTWAIEDATRTWPAPWVRVATIDIFQLYEIVDRDAEAERMTFTPWHALGVQQPLGGINRARLAIYHIMSAFRNAHNPAGNAGSSQAIVDRGCHDVGGLRAPHPAQ